MNTPADQEGSSRPAVPGLTEKSIVVTGAANGLGRAIAFVLGKAGARVVVADIDLGGATKTAAAIEQLGGQAHAVAVDVTSELSVGKMIQAAQERYGQLDGAVNNAGITDIQVDTHDMSAERWRRIMDVNLNGVFYCLKYQIPAMLQIGGGSIVNIASVTGMMAGQPGQADYAASKHAVVGLTRGAALDYATRGIRVNVVCPGGMITPMYEQVAREQPEIATRLLATVPMGRFGHPDEVAQAVAWLLSDAASYTTGACLAIDGGLTTGLYNKTP